MKKSLILVLLVLIAIPSYVNAKDADLFTFNRESVDLIMSDLTLIESYINDNPDATFTELTSMGLLTANGKDYSMDFMMQSGEPPLGIPSFLWGCVGGWVGLLVVYLVTDQDKVETRKALWGCVASSVTVTVIYVIYVAAIASAVTI